MAYRNSGSIHAKKIIMGNQRLKCNSCGDFVAYGVKESKYVGSVRVYTDREITPHDEYKRSPSKYDRLHLSEDAVVGHFISLTQMGITDPAALFTCNHCNGRAFDVVDLDVTKQIVMGRNFSPDVNTVRALVLLEHVKPDGGVECGAFSDPNNSHWTAGPPAVALAALNQAQGRLDGSPNDYSVRIVPVEGMELVIITNACDVCAKRAVGGSALLSGGYVVRHPYYRKCAAQRLKEVHPAATLEDATDFLQSAVRQREAWLVCQRCGDKMTQQGGFSQIPRDVWQRGVQRRQQGSANVGQMSTAADRAVIQDILNPSGLAFGVIKNDLISNGFRLRSEGRAPKPHGALARKPIANQNNETTRLVYALLFGLAIILSILVVGFISTRL